MKMKVVIQVDSDGIIILFIAFLEESIISYKFGIFFVKEYIALF